MRDCLLDAPTATSIPVEPVEESAFAGWLEAQSPARRRWLEAIGFRARPGSSSVLPGDDGQPCAYVVGIASRDDPWALGALPSTLPEGEYRLACEWDVEALSRGALGWALGAYRFTRYKNAERGMARLVLDSRCDTARVHAQAAAAYLVRDLVNTPAEDMMPGDMADAMAALADRHRGNFEQVVGEDLLERGYPAVHAVGRASTHAPRLLDLAWGDPAHPRVTLVGKGVCFDSGGLDIKTASGMRLMKKDMGGAAHVMGLAQLVMDTSLPVRLRVLVPAVENAVAAGAYRPGDVLRTRKGLSVEIDNTDAEGRVILCDALAEAASEEPALLADFATLTGAARVALGPDLPAMFSNTDEVANGLLETAAYTRDPLWRLPLHRPYREMLDSRVADIVNAANGPYAGAITAALFLQTFVPDATPWVHFDIMAWNVRSRPGRPEGGEALALRAVYEYLHRRFAA